MAGKGGPYGNQYGKKAALWASALKRALARISNESVDAGLDRCADKLVLAAVEGEKWALQELGDRMDGKSAQSVTIAGDDEAPLVINGIVKLVRP